MDTYQQLEALRPQIIEWAELRGIFKESTPYHQNLKTLEEVKELQDELELEEPSEAKVKDAIGDIVVTLILQWEMQARALVEKGEFGHSPFSDKGLATIDSHIAHSSRVLKDIPDWMAEDVFMGKRHSYQKKVLPMLVNFAMATSHYFKWKITPNPVENPSIIKHMIFSCMLAAAAYNWTLAECLTAAWDEIKGRTGRMEGGLFVKDVH